MPSHYNKADKSRAIIPSLVFPLSVSIYYYNSGFIATTAKLGYKSMTKPKPVPRELYMAAPLGTFAALLFVEGNVLTADLSARPPFGLRLGRPAAVTDRVGYILEDDIGLERHLMKACRAVGVFAWTGTTCSQVKS